MPPIVSPGWRTHLMFAEFDGEITTFDDHLVVRSPRSPSFYWGNFLLYQRPPAESDFERWMQRFEKAIVGPAPGTGHVAFGIAEPADTFDTPPAFAAAGFETLSQVTLTLQRTGLRPLPSRPAVAFEIRPLKLPAEAALVVDLSCACNDDGFEPDGYRVFRDHQMQRYGAMDTAGWGHWWGAVFEGRVVAALGLFGRDGVGRFQHVETHPAFRRRGLCRALVHAACRHGFEVRGWHTLVMLADPGDVAIGIYQSVGFERLDTLWQLERRARGAAARP